MVVLIRLSIPGELVRGVLTSSSMSGCSSCSFGSCRGERRLSRHFGDGLLLMEGLTEHRLSLTRATPPRSSNTRVRLRDRILGPGPGQPVNRSRDSVYFLIVDVRYLVGFTLHTTAFKGVASVILFRAGALLAESPLAQACRACDREVLWVRGQALRGLCDSGELQLTLGFSSALMWGGRY